MTTPNNLQNDRLHVPTATKPRREVSQHITVGPPELTDFPALFSVWYCTEVIRPKSHSFLLSRNKSVLPPCSIRSMPESRSMKRVIMMCFCRHSCCCLPYVRSLANSSSFSKTVPRRTGRARQSTYRLLGKTFCRLQSFLQICGRQTAPTSIYLITVFEG